MDKSGDMTVERLLYEDYKDRESRKINQPVTDADFRDILCGLANQYYNGTTSFPKHNLNQFLPGTNAAEAKLQEIIDGGLLVPSGNFTTPYKVDSRRLIHGLGMLLADHVIKSVTDNSVNDLLDVINAWLEPQPDIDMKASIVGAAVFFSLTNRAYPVNARRALLLSWISFRNLPDEQEENIYAYLPECIADITSIADTCWRKTSDNGMAQTRLANAFFARRDDERVKPELIRAANRWMSYVNFKGHPYERGAMDENQSKLSEAITKRFGCELTPDEDAKFLQWSFPITDDDGLLQLARFALLIISGGDRISFVEAFVLWAISRQLMGQTSEFDTAAWTLHLSDEDLWPHFKPVLLNMIESGNETLRKAADLLLRCLGCKDALALRSIQLVGLYPPDDWQKESEQDPFTSFSVGLSKDQIVPCMLRDDLPLNHIRNKINKFLLDSTINAPQEFVVRLREAARSLPAGGFRAKFAYSQDDSVIEHYEPILARFSSHDYCDVLRRAVRSLPERNDEGKQELLTSLPEISFILHNEEISVLQEVLGELWESGKLWTKFISGSIIERDRHSETMGFLALAMHLTPEEVAETMISRPPHCFDLRKFQYWFVPLPDDVLSNYLDRLLSEDDKSIFKRIIWVLSNAKPTIADPHRARFKELLESSDDELKGEIYRFIRSTEVAYLIDYVLKQKNPFLFPEKNWSDKWYFEILCRFGGEMHISDFSSSLSLTNIGMMVDRRGCCKEEVSAFVKRLDDVLKQIVKRNSVEETAFPSIMIKTYFDCGVSFTQHCEPPNDSGRCLLSRDLSWGGGSHSAIDDLQKAFTSETDEQYLARQDSFKSKIEELSSKVETSLWSSQFSATLLKQVFRDYPDMVKRWVDIGLGNKNILIACEGFYQSLCAALVDIDPHRGFSLWRHICSETSHIRIGDFETNSELIVKLPFSAEPSNEAQAARIELLDKCWSDAGLIELATVATAYHCHDWLLEQVNVMLCSEQLWRRAKGLMLACLSDMETDCEELIAAADIANSWVENCFDHLRRMNANNRWARYWYNRFLTIDDEDEAYSAYVLFLKCADRRCRLWMHSLEEDRISHGILKTKRIQFRLTNYQQIDSAIEENEKDLKNHFLTIKYYKGQLWPFV